MKNVTDLASIEQCIKENIFRTQDISKKVIFFYILSIVLIII